MGGLFGGGGPDIGAINRQAEERAAAERRKADQKAFEASEARARTQQGRRATVLTDDRARLNASGLLG